MLGVDSAGIQWQALKNAIINLWVTKMIENFFTSWPWGSEEICVSWRQLISTVNVKYGDFKLTSTKMEKAWMAYSLWQAMETLIIIIVEVVV